MPCLLAELHNIAHMIWPIMTKFGMVSQVGRRVFLEVSYVPSQGTQAQRLPKVLRRRIYMHTVWILGYSFVWTVAITASGPDNYDDLHRVEFCPWPTQQGTNLQHSIRSLRMHRYEACKAITSRNAGGNLLRNSGMEGLNFRIAESTEHSPYNTEVHERSKTYKHVTWIADDCQLSHVGWTRGNDTEQLRGGTVVIPTTADNEVVTVLLLSWLEVWPPGVNCNWGLDPL